MTHTSTVKGLSFEHQTDSKKLENRFSDDDGSLVDGEKSN